MLDAIWAVRGKGASTLPPAVRRQGGIGLVTPCRIQSSARIPGFSHNRQPLAPGYCGPMVYPLDISLCSTIVVILPTRRYPNGSGQCIQVQSESGGTPAEERRLPDDVKKVDVIVLGNARLLAPAGEAWTTWFDSPGVSEDFMVEARSAARAGTVVTVGGHAVHARHERRDSHHPTSPA